MRSICRWINVDGTHANAHTWTHCQWQFPLYVFVMFLSPFFQWFFFQSFEPEFYSNHLKIYEQLKPYSVYWKLETKKKERKMENKISSENILRELDLRAHGNKTVYWTWKKERKWKSTFGWPLLCFYFVKKFLWRFFYKIWRQPSTNFSTKLTFFSLPFPVEQINEHEIESLQKRWNKILKNTLEEMCWMRNPN